MFKNKKSKADIYQATKGVFILSFVNIVGIFTQIIFICLHNKMRITYILLFLIIIKLQALGQTTIWHDDFDPAQNWQLDDHWWIDEGYMRFDGFPVVNDFDFSTVSPVISLGEHQHELIIKQRLEVFEYAVTTEKSEISKFTYSGSS